MIRFRSVRALGALIISLALAVGVPWADSSPVSAHGAGGSALGLVAPPK